jgi:hypothetical protein
MTPDDVKRDVVILWAVITLAVLGVLASVLFG